MLSDFSLAYQHTTCSRPEHLFYEKELKSLRSRSHQVKQRAKRKLCINAPMLVNVLKRCGRLEVLNTAHITGGLGLELSITQLAENLKRMVTQRNKSFGIKSLTLSSVFTLMQDNVTLTRNMVHVMTQFYSF